MQGLAHRHAADARLGALQGRTLWLVVLAGVALTIIFAQSTLQIAFVQTAQPGIAAIKVDFRIFWAAARLALAGEPLAAFDMARLAQMHQVAPEAFMPWLYPPGYLLLIMPLGLVPFAPAFLIFVLLSVVAIGCAVRPFVAGLAPVWLAASLAPAYVPALILGQNSLLWLAGLLAALAALRDGRMMLAGVFLGCLTLKPQLGVLIPVALLAAGLWRTLFAAAATACVLAVVPTLIFGPEYWHMFARQVALMGSTMVINISDIVLMVGPVFLLSSLGLPVDLALRVQWGIMAAAVVIVALLWRSDRIGFDAKVAGLMLAMLLSAPYLWYYEAAMMALIGLFMVRAGLLGQTLPQVLLLLCLWSGSILLVLNAYFDFTDSRMLGAILLTPILLTSMVLVLLQFALARRSPSAVA